MAVLFACLFFSCEEKSMELKESFTIPAAYRPGNVFASINSALIDEALTQGQDSAYQIGGAGNLPAYEDLEFYPVLTAKDLHRVVENSIRKNEYDVYVNNIDFNTHFAFIVAHPESYETTYFDELIAKGSGKGLLKLKLNSRVLGNAKTGIEALMQKWKIKVYNIERKGYDSLTVQLNEDTYPFRIK